MSRQNSCCRRSNQSGVARHSGWAWAVCGWPVGADITRSLFNPQGQRSCIILSSLQYLNYRPLWLMKTGVKSKKRQWLFDVDQQYLTISRRLGVHVDSGKVVWFLDSSVAINAGQVHNLLTWTFKNKSPISGGTTVIHSSLTTRTRKIIKPQRIPVAYNWCLVPPNVSVKYRQFMAFVYVNIFHATDKLKEPLKMFFKLIVPTCPMGKCPVDLNVNPS